MGMRIAVIGPGTGKKLEEYGFYPDICPEIFDAEHLGIALAEKTAPSERILLCRAEKGSPALTERLLQAGREFTDFALYSLRIDPEKRKMRSGWRRKRIICCLVAHPVLKHF